MSQVAPTEKVNLKGGCICKNLRYSLGLASKDEARASLCHCHHCKKAFGGVFGLKAKVPLHAFRYTSDSAKPTVHIQDNGSGTDIYREFCSKCGAYICEYGEQAKGVFRYVTVGSLDEPEALPPKGEFFCSQRVDWMPEIPGISQEL
ncbi:DUF636 domain protein [Lophiotrema nucula]|uniref:DUF636 domain protein n=1 Tax=Lophiotrema nucula TaxID=690887 RepID=A0A6A5Z1P9_9PLEO|nr:DUF636 domain protein [Lophiotrema nucula]